MSGLERTVAGRVASLELGASKGRPFTEIEFALAVILAESLAIVALSTMSGILYHLAYHGSTGPLWHYVPAGVLAALCYIVPAAYRDEYRVSRFLERAKRPGRVLLLWNMTFLTLATAAFLTKMIGDVSRGWILVFYASGLVSLVLLERWFGRALESALQSGRIVSGRALIVGSSADVAEFLAMRRMSAIRIADVVEISAGADRPDDLQAQLAQAVSHARRLRVDTVVVASALERSAPVCIEAFKDLPVAIHIGAGPVLRRFPQAVPSEVSGVTTLAVVPAPMSVWQALSKRGLDMGLAALALLALSPLFLIVAALIKLDTPGPVFFRQRRRGFNHHEFRIWKFRTMTTLDDRTEHVQQASKQDGRITRVGRYLRRLSVDELPQLINVLAGDMSLVGPRPHAVAHDLLYETRIADYVRRLNMRPGITGWAQINGCRGETEQDDAMRRRVEYDLFYIQNWSIGFDLYILVMTVLSPRTFRNAY